ncbi:MAG: transposase [Kofleriaceae bacterium]
MVIRAVEEVGSLRTRRAYLAIRKALVVTFTREDFRIVHVSIQGTHIHLLVEAQHRQALTRGMQAFQISAAKHLNTAISVRRTERRRGTVFPDRYHAVVIRSPRQARSALAYVLRGLIKTRVDRGSRSGDQVMCVWRPKTVLGRFAVGFVGIRSPDSRLTTAINSTA